MSYEPSRVSHLLRSERPDLWETWQDDNTLDAHVARIIRNATWLIQQHQATVSSLASTSQLRSLSDSGLLPTAALQQAIWLSTPEDDLAELTALDRGDGASQPTSLPSDWFSIS